MKYGSKDGLFEEDINDLAPYEIEEMIVYIYDDNEVLVG